MHSPEYSKYIGVPFLKYGRSLDGWDCWGMVRFIFEEEYKIHLSRLEGATSVDCDLASEEKKLWLDVSAPREGDIVEFKLAKNLHVGLMIDDENMLHSINKIGTCVERISSPLWTKRIVGFYRHYSMSESV